MKSSELEEILMDSINDLIKLELSKGSETEIIESMGYVNVEKGINRLHKVLDDQHLGLGTGGYDGVYSTEEFVRKLLLALDVNIKNVDSFIKSLMRDASDENFGFRPYLYIDTGFNRTTQPIFALAFCEGQRRRILCRSIKNLSRDDQINEFRSLVREHDEINGRETGVWGRAIRYVCYLKPDDIVIMSPDGSIIAEQDEYNYAQIVSIHI